MRLCFLAAGNSVHSYRWIRFFAEREHEIHWLSLTPGEFPELPNTRFYDLSCGSGKWAALARAGLRIRGLVRDIAPDIVHAHYAGSYGLLGVLSGFQPFVLSAWGSDILFAGNALVRGAFVRRALERARLITCDAHHMIDAMQQLGTDRGKIHLIFFGVEVDRFVPGPKDDQILARWEVAGKRVVISLRNLEPIYSTGTLLEAVPLVTRAVSDARFVIASTGSCEENLRADAARLAIMDHVRFIGRYSNAELPSMLRSSDVYVSTSLSDAGIAASTAEAMACGIPVVISNTGENNKWIVDGLSGYLVPAKDAQTLADRIIRLLKDDSSCTSMGAAGRAVIEERDNYAREMAKMEGLYGALLDNRLDA